MSSSSDTIFARSSGAGRAGIAVWRVSGPLSRTALERFAAPCPTPRKAAWRVIRTEEGEVLDDGIVLWFPGPKSATGEDVAEFHLHGSLAVGEKFVAMLTELGGRPAEPGEFTLRAFANGRMDLLAVEGLGDLLDAETEGQRQQAIAGAEGKAREQIDQWRQGLIEALAVLEAAVDFPDEEDIPADIASRAVPRLSSIRTEMKEAMEMAAQGRRLREGIDLAIIGPPNVGKSSLLNRLLGEDRAIVSDIAGTTRDVVTARFELSGRLINVLDTAGLREDTDDPIEREGIARSRKAAATADIIVSVSDGTLPPYDAEELNTAAHIISVRNKSDLRGEITPGSLSVATGQGWEAFLTELKQAVEHQAAPSLFPRERQQSLVAGAMARLDRILENPAAEPELLAEDVRACLSGLDHLVGRSTTEEVLGTIFSSFCIGK